MSKYWVCTVLRRETKSSQKWWSDESVMGAPSSWPKWLGSDNHNNVTKITYSTPILNHRGHTRIPPPPSLRIQWEQVFLDFLCSLSFGSGEVFHSHFLMIERYWLRVHLIINFDIKCATAEIKITKSAALVSPTITEWTWPTLMYLQD